MTLTLDKTGERLDAALARLVPSLSRSQAQRLIEQGAVTHGGRPVKKNEKLSAGDTLELTLPVAGDWSYALLDLAPCRYAGSAYLDDLVILGHNYRGFFRDLSQLQPGDTVFFTDTDGNRFSYAAADFEQLRLSQTEDMLAGDWDLTLFTCTTGGRARCAVRCVRTGYPVLTTETAE